MSGSKPVQDQMNKAGTMSGLGGAVSAGAGMIGTMAFGTWSSNVSDSNDTTESTIGMVSTMAPMIGSMFGPWGMAIGALLGAAGLAFNTWNKTDEELLKEAEELTKGLEDLKKTIEEDEKKLETAETDEARFNELIKGINQSTGKNISLNDSEFAEYQTILQNIIDMRSDLYAAYDEEGNLIAKNANGTIDLNNAM